MIPIEKMSIDVTYQLPMQSQSNQTVEFDSTCWIFSFLINQIGMINEALFDCSLLYLFNSHLVTLKQPREIVFT